MSRDEIVQMEKEHMANVYSKRDIVVVKGKDTLVWDINGKEYIDCLAGYGTAFIGHSNEKVIAAIREQTEKLLACHGSVYNDARAQLIQKLINIAPKGLRRVFLSNSGAESVEAAIKLSRKYTGKKEIIAMMRSFHGKTFGALSATWSPKYRTPFEPLMPKVKFVPFGRADKVREAITPNTAGIIVEPVQGEGGVYVSPDGYLAELRETADKEDVMLIFDEIQTGFGRTGKIFAYEHWDVIPDILCLAKAGGSGVPIGMTLSRDDIMSSLRIGEHSNTFGGNPIASVASSATIDIIVEGKLWEVAADIGNYFMSSLKKLTEKYRVVREARGLGLMLGLDLRFDVLHIILKMIENGVLIMSAGTTTLRFLPPCTITKKQVNLVVKGLDDCLADMECQLAAKTSVS